MASGLGTFNGPAVRLTTNGGVGALVSATVSQSVDAANRKVTITVTAYAGYHRYASGNWSVSDGTAFWGTETSGAYLKVTLDGSTQSITNKIGVASKGAQTISSGANCTIPNGKAKARSGYSAQVSISKTFDYDTSGSAITKSWRVDLHEYGNTSTNSGWHDCHLGSGGDGDPTRYVTTDAIGVEPIAPSGAGVSLKGCTYNSVDIESTVSSWGQGYSGTPNLEQLVVNGSATSSDWWNWGRQSKQNSTYSTSDRQVVTNNNSIAQSGGFTIKGATPFKIMSYASTSVGATSYFDDTPYYTPPAPLQSFNYSQSQGSTNVQVSTYAIGGDSSVNSWNNVDTYICFSTDGGATYSNWAYDGTGLPWDTYYGMFDCPYGANVVIVAKQVYQGKESEWFWNSFTATNGTAPSYGTVDVVSSAWDYNTNTPTITLQVANVNYGKPDGVSGRKIAIGVSGSPYNLDNKRENQYEDVTSYTATVTNSSIYPGASGLQLKGMLPVYPYLWVWNTISSSLVAHHSSPYYLPPAPGVVSYTDDFHGDYTIRYTGNPALNVSDYTVSELKRTVRYKIDDGNWVYVDNDTTKTLEAVTSEQIHVPYQSTATVEAWMTYRGQNSGVSSFSITNTIKDLKLYGSVNGVAENIEHLYGSVNGQSKKVVKLYGSVGGVATEVYRDE